MSKNKLLSNFQIEPGKRFLAQKMGREQRWSCSSINSVELIIGVCASFLSKQHESLATFQFSDAQNDPVMKKLTSRFIFCV